MKILSWMVVGATLALLLRPAAAHARPSEWDRLKAGEDVNRIKSGIAAARAVPQALAPERAGKRPPTEALWNGTYFRTDGPCEGRTLTVSVVSYDVGERLRPSCPGGKGYALQTDNELGEKMDASLINCGPIRGRPDAFDLRPHIPADVAFLWQADLTGSGATETLVYKVGAYPPITFTNVAGELTIFQIDEVSKSGRPLVTRTCKYRRKP